MLHVFLFNKKAGKNNSNQIDKIINDYCILQGVQFVIEYVYDKQDTKKIIDKYKLMEDVILYSVGGDGTLNEIINYLSNTNIKLNVIPTGTGNDFYKSLSSYEGKKIDLGKVNDRFFINVASFGIDAEIANTANELKNKNIKGKSVYTFSIIKNFLPYKALNMNVDNINKLITIVTICNGKYYGGGYNIAPTAELNDGLFDIYEVGNINKIETLKLITKLLKAKHMNEENVKFYRTDRITINSCYDLNCNIDGEIIKGRNFNFSLEKEAITLANDDLKIKQLLKKHSIIK